MKMKRIQIIKIFAVLLAVFVGAGIFVGYLKSPTTAESEENVEIADFLPPNQTMPSEITIEMKKPELTETEQP